MAWLGLSLNNRRIFFLVVSLALMMVFLGGVMLLQGVSTPFSSLLFPTLTIFLFVLHVLIGVFMVMKYCFDKRRLYLMCVACAFFGSALFMIGTLFSFPTWFILYDYGPVKYNDTTIFFMFRNILMMLMFTSALVLYKRRKQVAKKFNTHGMILFLIFFALMAILELSYLCSSYSNVLQLELIDDYTYSYHQLWSRGICLILVLGWALNTVMMVRFTRLKNIFWMSMTFLCLSYTGTLTALITDNYVESYAWYCSRIFEAVATLFILITLLFDVFKMYSVSRDQYQISYQNSIRDPLTRIYNRSYFFDNLNTLLRDASPATPVSVVVSDLDRFKRINDTYGHVQGDKVIQFVAGVLTNAVRSNDIAARVGGEEFALLLVNTNAHDAMIIAERIRQRIANHNPLESEGQLPEQITISMGVFTTECFNCSAEECVKNADKAMYMAKHRGRNRVVYYELPAETNAANSCQEIEQQADELTGTSR